MSTYYAEEQIYSKVNWDQTTGVDRNRYFLWDAEREPRPQSGPPRRPLPTEMEIDPDTLVSGGSYPGEYEGMELTCDSRGNASNLTGIYASDTGELADLLVRVKGSGGRFRVTPKRLFVLVRVLSGEEWETVYVTRLPRPLQFVGSAAAVKSVENALQWQEHASPGDVYPFGGLKMSEPDLRFRQKSGGVISKKVRTYSWQT